MKTILKIIGVITSILAILAGIKLILGKFCKKNCDECDACEEDDIEIAAEPEETGETAPETEETNNEEQGE